MWYEDLSRPSVESAAATCSTMRGKLLESGVQVDHSPTQYVFAQDYVFNTPTGAAVTVLGRPSNGWQDWKDDHGRTLHEVKRAPIESLQDSAE